MDTILNIALAAAMGLYVFHAAFAHGRLRMNLAIIKQYRPVHFLTNIPVIAAIIIVSNLLNMYIPFMDKNPFLWILSLFTGGDGTGTTNVIAVGTQWKWYALIFFPVLLIALPLLAQIEEHIFRRNTKNWRQGFVRSFIFGLAHLLALIPIGTAIALTIGGLWFTLQYFRGGVARSTVYHAVYNSIVTLVLFTTLVIF